MDETTIGVMAAQAMAAGAVEASKSVLGKAASDAYDLLRSCIARWSKGDVTQLEANAMNGTPTKVREAALAEVVDGRPPEDREAVRVLAEALWAALAAEGRGSTTVKMANQFNAYHNSRQFNAPGGTQIFNAPTGGSSVDK